MEASRRNAGMKSRTVSSHLPIDPCRMSNKVDALTKHVKQQAGASCKATKRHAGLRVQSTCGSQS